MADGTSVGRAPRMTGARGTVPPPDAVMPERAPGAPAPGEPIPSHYRWCLGCGADHPGGLHMSAIAGPGMSAIAQLQITDYHQGAPGLAHGGIISTAMDEALGVLSRLLSQPVVTVHLEVDFRRPIPVGSTVHITTRIVGVKGRKVYVDGAARLGDPDGPVAVTAAGLFLQVPLEHFLNNGNPEQVAAAIEDRRRGGPSWVAEVNP